MFSFRANYCYGRPSSIRGGVARGAAAVAITVNSTDAREIRCAGASERVFGAVDRLLTAVALGVIARQKRYGDTVPDVVTLGGRARLSEKKDTTTRTHS